MADDWIEEALNTVNWSLVGPGDHALSSARGAARHVASTLARHVASTLENSIVKQLCEALQVPYGSDDGHGIRYPTLDEVLAWVKSRSDMWRLLITRIELVDPEWLDALRKGEDLWEGPFPPTVRLAIKIHNDNKASVWNRARMPMAEFVALLRQAADQFESGEAERLT